jgi:hypothetical protein
MRAQRVTLDYQEVDEFVLMNLQFYILQCTAEGMENLWTVSMRKWSTDSVIIYLHAFTPITRDDAVKMIINELQREYDEMRKYRENKAVTS